MSFITKEAKERVLDFSKWAVKVLWFYSALWQYSTIYTQYSTLNVKLSNSQLNKSKSALKNRFGVTLNLLSDIIGDSHDENNFTHE